VYAESAFERASDASVCRISLRKGVCDFIGFAITCSAYHSHHNHHHRHTITTAVASPSPSPTPLQVGIVGQLFMDTMNGLNQVADTSHALPRAQAPPTRPRPPSVHTHTCMHHANMVHTHTHAHTHTHTHTHTQGRMNMSFCKQFWYLKPSFSAQQSRDRLTCTQEGNLHLCRMDACAHSV
jgi:hypothetical protein